MPLFFHNWKPTLPLVTMDSSLMTQVPYKFSAKNMVRPNTNFPKYDIGFGTVVNHQ